MSLLRRAPLWVGPVLVAAATAVAVGWLLYTTNAVRSEARARFYEQYNRQQLLLAQQASRTVEQLFDTFRRELGLVVSLFEEEPATKARAEEVKGSLRRVYQSLEDTPVLDLAVFDRSGTILWSYPPSPRTIGVNLGWRDYFVWAREHGKPGQIFVTPLRLQAAGKVRGEKALNMVQGIYGQNREFHGIALFTVNFDELARKHILPLRIGENGYAWLVDTKSRDVLVDPQGKVTGHTFASFLPRWPQLHALLQATTQGNPGTGSYQYEDPVDPSKTVKKLVGYAPIRIGDGLWVLGVATPEREVEDLLSSFLKRQEVVSTALGVTLLAGAALICTLLLAWNRTLVRQVAVRTRDLADARAELVTAEKLAAAGQLALGLTHEIRNPLSAIRMNVQMIREEYADQPHLLENFDIVEEEIQRLNRLLSDVMGFAKPRPLRLSKVDLTEEIGRVVRLMGRRFEDEGISVDASSEGRVEVVCDPEQVQQVLLNLVLNAAEAMRETSGPRKLSLKAERSGDTAVLRVSDTGAGIRAEDRDRIFDAFYTTKAQGGGLGLASVQSIALRHGGSATVESEEMRGTTISVRLPVGGPSGVEGAAP